MLEYCVVNRKHVDCFAIFYVVTTHRGRQRIQAAIDLSLHVWTDFESISNVWYSVQRDVQFEQQE